MKIANIDKEIPHIFLRNFNKIFRKNMTYNNIKSHKKEGLHAFFGRYIFRKTTVGGQIDPPPAVLELKERKTLA